MVTNLVLLIASGSFISISHFIAKNGFQKGVSPNAYVYVINIATFFFVLPLFFFFDFEILKPLDALFFFLIFIASISRWINNFGFTNTLNKVTPLELTSFTSVVLVLTYLFDIILNAATLNYLSLFFLVFIAFVTIHMTMKIQGSIRFKTVLIVFVITAVLRGYTTYFSLMYINEFAFALIISAGSLLFFLPFILKFKPSTITFKVGILAQGLGMVNFIALIFLAGHSTTLYMLAFPTKLAMTILLTLVIKEGFVDKPSKHQLASSLLILIGVIGYVLTQI